MLALALSLAAGCGTDADDSLNEGGGLQSAESEPLSSEISDSDGTAEPVAVQTSTFVTDPWSTVVTGTLKTDEQYSVSMKGEPAVTESRTSFIPFSRPPMRGRTATKR